MPTASTHHGLRGPPPGVPPRDHLDHRIAMSFPPLLGHGPAKTGFRIDDIRPAKPGFPGFADAMRRARCRHHRRQSGNDSAAPDHRRRNRQAAAREPSPAASPHISTNAHLEHPSQTLIVAVGPEHAGQHRPGPVATPAMRSAAAAGHLMPAAIARAGLENPDWAGDNRRHLRPRKVGRNPGGFRAVLLSFQRDFAAKPAPVAAQGAVLMAGHGNGGLPGRTR